jgi:hypothetical protein
MEAGTTLVSMGGCIVYIEVEFQQKCSVIYFVSRTQGPVVGPCGDGSKQSSYLKLGNFLTSWTTISFSRIILHRGVSCFYITLFCCYSKCLVCLLKMRRKDTFSNCPTRLLEEPDILEEKWVLTAKIWVSVRPRNKTPESPMEKFSFRDRQIHKYKNKRTRNILSWHHS